jgi:hypothetical protein
MRQETSSIIKVTNVGTKYIADIFGMFFVYTSVIVSLVYLHCEDGGISQTHH